MMPALLALEAEGWSLEALRRSQLLPLAVQAAREAMAVVAAHRREKPSVLRRLLRPWMLRQLLAWAPRVLPLDFEAYLRYHFTKVGDQTREMVATYLKTARAHGLEAGALEKLEQRALRP